ncbi:CRE-CLEC-50 protein [Aphelenchoides avenae]|nr:CRE-CLEC-50 protein [Aphelenchus avenae]
MLTVAVSFAVLGVALARYPSGSLQGLEATDCYKQSDPVDSWYFAEERCRMLGGHLDSVSGGFANALLREFALWDATGFWLGANEDAGGEWTWTDGQNVSYTSWALGPLIISNNA